jgi:hypothetical protein
MSGIKITPVKFDGVDAVEILTPEIRLVAITAFGPRIAFLGKPGGANLLYWAPEKHLRGEWNLRGGHRVWITRPGADEAEETYGADNGACAVELSPDGVTITGALDPVQKLRRGFSVRVLAAGRLQLDNFVRNESDMLWSGGLWGLTCTVPGKQTSYIAPLGDGSSWDYATIVAFRTWGGGHGGVGFADSQFETTKDAFVVRPAGRENKRMLKADAGLIAMHDPERGVLFAIKTEYQAAAHYPLGTNLAFYVGPENFMVEMETMGPVVTLKPGQISTHTERLALCSTGATSPDNAALMALFA